MSATNRPTSRWSSSTKSSNSTNQTIPIVAPRKKLYRPVVNQQHTFTRMAKTRHDVEQLFKLYYSANIKFDTFQKQVVTGKFQSFFFKLNFYYIRNTYSKRTNSSITYSRSFTK